jgi:Ni/Fe-hydrogenase 1 B-type cytochrome subunit
VKKNSESGTSIKAYAVWDRTTRLFHWINVVCVLTLTILGLAILNEKAFGVSSDGKILLKTLHAYVGYGFAINLAWRFVWAFIGSPTARWQAILPAARGFPSALRTYVQGFFNKEAPIYLGHNPLGRLMVSALLFLLLTQATTGLVLAGTDLYKPPFGSAIAEWVTGGDPEKLANLEPGSKDFVDPVAYQSMRNFRSPIITTHLYVFYLLMFLIFLHITGVVITEVRERNGIISAMFTGEKILPAAPIDMQSAPSGNGGEKQADEI